LTWLRRGRRRKDVRYKVVFFTRMCKNVFCCCLSSLISLDLAEEGKGEGILKDDMVQGGRLCQLYITHRDTRGHYFT
jgi:hypothetical protein